MRGRRREVLQYAPNLSWYNASEVVGPPPPLPPAPNSALQDLETKAHRAMQHDHCLQRMLRERGKRRKRKGKQTKNKKQKKGRKRVEKEEGCFRRPTTGTHACASKAAFCFRNAANLALIGACSALNSSNWFEMLWASDCALPSSFCLDPRTFASSWLAAVTASFCADS